jgi:hypothetical protein
MKRYKRFTALVGKGKGKKESEKRDGEKRNTGTVLLRRMYGADI